MIFWFVVLILFCSFLCFMPSVWCLQATGGSNLRGILMKEHYCLFVSTQNHGEGRYLHNKNMRLGGQEISSHGCDVAFCHRDIECTIEKNKKKASSIAYRPVLWPDLLVSVQSSPTTTECTLNGACSTQWRKHMWSLWSLSQGLLTFQVEPTINIWGFMPASNL